MRARSRKAICTLCLLILVYVPGLEARDALSLPPAVASIMAKRGIPAEHVSIWAQDVDSDQVILGFNSDEPRTPASTIKTVTTFAALDILGPAYTWKTRAYTNGPLSNGTLNGDLVLVGGGDPFMTVERWWAFVGTLRRAGVDRINGDVVIDHGFFEPLAEDRAAFDGQPFRTYNVAPDGLIVNFQTSQFLITADRDRQSVRVAVDPMPANLEVQNHLKLGSGRCRGYNRGVSFSAPEGPAGNVVRLTGTFPAACSRFAINRAIMSAPAYAFGTFKTLFEQSGGRIAGGVRIETRPQDARLLVTYDSLTLAEIIRLVNKHSSNVMARTLLLTIGAEKYGVPATEERGRQALRDWMLERGLEIPGFHVENGSGLSRRESITAHGLGQILHAAWHSRFMPEFSASLPLSAIDGTLRNRFHAAGMEGRLRMKTGRIDDVNGIAGYVTSASGRRFIVVVIVNHRGAHLGPGEEVQNAVLRWVFGQ